MENSAGNKNPNKRNAKLFCLSAVVLAILVLFIVPIVFAGNTQSGGNHRDSDKSDKEESFRHWKTSDKNQAIFGDEDDSQRKKRKSRESRESANDKSDEGLPRKKPVVEKETLKPKDAKRVVHPAEPAESKKTAQIHRGNVIEHLSGEGKSNKQQTLKDPRGTAKLHKDALEVALKKGDLHGQKEAHTKLGQTYRFTGQYKRAAEHYSKALEMARRTGTPRDKGRALHRLTGVLLAMADYRSAERYAQESLKDMEKVGDAEGVASAYNDLGLLEKNRGRFQKSMQNYQKALDANKEPNELRLATLNNLGSLCLSWGEYKRAAEYYREALESARQSKNTAAEGKALISVARVDAEWGRHEEALSSALQGLQVLSNAGAPTAQAKKIIGDLYLDVGKLDQAEPYVKEAGYESSLGRLCLLRRQYDEAKKHYEKLKELSEQSGNLNDSFTALTGLGKVAEALKDYRAAETYYSEAVHTTEQIRSTLLLAERKNFFAANINGFPRSEPAKGLVRVTLKENKPEESLYASELARAREFADNLAEKTDGHNFNVPQEVLEQEEELTNRLAGFMNGRNLIPKSADKERFDELSQEIKTLESDRNSFVQMLWRNYPAYASAKYPLPVKLQQSSVAPDEYVIVFDLLGEGLGVKLLHGKTIADAYFTPLDIRELESDVTRFRKPFEQVKLRQFDVGLAEALYAKLLARPMKMIPRGSPVSIIPDGFLALLPFDALVVQGEVHWQDGPWGPYPQGLTYAGDLHPLASYQSVTALTIVRTLMSKRAPGKRMLVMADPVFAITDARAQHLTDAIRLAKNETSPDFRLMAAVEEENGGSLNLNRLVGTGEFAEDLQKLYGTDADVYLGLQSSKENLLRKIAPKLDTYKYVVFATHGFAGNSIPGIMEPVLALTMVPPGTNGLLTASEVAGLKMDADVAALTACQTGLGLRLAGEGVMSMGRAFQLAGARSVIMSLWSVSETSSIKLMESFFKNLKQGKPKLEALSEAKSELRSAGFEHPFFWSAFVLVGETK
jgi:CHAT domain-containing protein/Tfp pilus assembly protein PilF